MRIALIGSAPSSVRGAPYRDASFVEFLDGRPVLEKHHKPFADQSWEIWGCSPGVFGVAERLTAWFEMHRWEPGQTWFSPEYCEWIRKFNGPVYTTEVIPEIPNSVRIPREELVREFGPHFFTSSLSFMTAMAIMRIWHEREQRKAVGLEPEEDVIAYFGVDMAATEEYSYQRAGCQFFMREALNRGIKIALPPESDLARPMPMYGVSEWSWAHIKILARKRELEGRLNNARAMKANAEREEYFLQGALDDLKYMELTWVLNENSQMIGPDVGGRQLLYMQPNEPA